MTDAPFLSADERREVLRVIGKERDLKVLIETGTNDGGTPWALKDDFDEIITIELGQRQWRAAKERFKNYPHVTCLQGDSGVVLPEVLRHLERPALLWLDGHWSGGDTAHGEEDTPILAELEAAFAAVDAKQVRHVILVDDARLFEGMSHYGEHDWPHVDAVKTLAEVNGYRYECVDDIIRLYPT